MGHSKKLPRKLDDLKHVLEPKAREVKLSLCSVGFFTLAVKTVALVIFYYIFSIGLTFYNQRLIQHFQFPLSMTVTHLVFKFMLAGLFRSLLECKTKKERITLPWGMYMRRICPVGIATALDIGLSNWSFEFITVSLYTMTKSSAVLFILLFALFFGLEMWRWSLMFVVLFISAGLFMFTYHSTQFNMEGFSMVLIASVLSGIRWTLSQIVLQKQEIGLHNPLDMMYHIQPWMIIGILPLSVGFEGISMATTDQLFRYSDVNVVLRNFGIVTIGAGLAFCLEFSEYLLLSQTSSLTLSISGIFKELCTLYLAAHFNGDKMTLLNGIGLGVCLIGIILHVTFKAVHVHAAASSEVHHIEHMEMLTRDGEPNLTDNEEEVDIFNVRNDR